jgi:uroporphyrinogen-III synthase
MSRPIYLFSISSDPRAISINPLSIEFFKPSVDFSQYDNFIITSKQIAKILHFYEVPKECLKPALCISQQSAKSYKAIGGDVLAIGKGYGDTLVQKIQEYPKETKWLYLRAKEVASNFVQETLHQGYIIDEAILYESSCSNNLENLCLNKDATLIFTSPSSVKCFMQKNTILPSYSIIVIGESTKKALPYDVQCKTAKKTTIESCISAAKSL